MTNQTSDASFVVSLGLSLTFAMGAAMFVMVGFNPKQPDAYSYLPWVYSLTSAALAAVTGFIARRFLVESDSPN